MNVTRFTSGQRDMCKHYAQSSPRMRGMQMRTAIALAIVVGIGLIWSVAAISKLVPVPSEDLKATATSPYVLTAGQGKSGSSP